MRAVLECCGYVEEAHYRRAWLGAAGEVHGGIGYAILRQDWVARTTMLVQWDG